MFATAYIEGWVQSYFWPFLRLSALLLAAPLFGASSVTVRVRILLGLLVTGLIAPYLPPLPSIGVLTPVGLVLVAQQIVVGLAMGFILQMAFGAVVIAGQSLAMTMGLGFAMTVDPQNGVQVPVLSQLYVILSTLIFLVTDSHLVLIQLLAESFHLLPVSLSGWPEDLPMKVVLWGSNMFLIALLIALPTLTALLLINLAFGVITRAAPQLNIFAVGFPVTILAGFIFVLLSLPSVISLFGEMFDTAMAGIAGLFG